MSWAPAGIVADNAPPKRGRAISLLAISSQAKMQVTNAESEIQDVFSSSKKYPASPVSAENQQLRFKCRLGKCTAAVNKVHTFSYGRYGEINYLQYRTIFP